MPRRDEREDGEEAEWAHRAARLPAETVGGGLDTVSHIGVLVGIGAYEALSAVLVFDFRQHPVDVVGAIFPGEMPPVATVE